MKNKNIDKVQVGRRIRNIRINQKMTMKKFGEMFTPIASDSIVSRWERGISLPNNQRLKEIADLGNTSTNYILYGVNDIVLPSFNDFNDIQDTINSISHNRKLSIETIAEYSGINLLRLKELQNNTFITPTEQEVKQLSFLVGSAIGQILCYYRLCETYSIEPFLEFKDFELNHDVLDDGLLGRLQAEYIDLVLLRNTVYLSNIFDDKKRVILENEHLSTEERQKVVDCLNDILANRK